MKVILKFPVYVLAEFDKNVPRDLVSNKLREFYGKHLDPELNVSSIQHRRVLRELEETLGCNVSVKFLTETDLIKNIK